jgi:hypothetical protein
MGILREGLRVSVGLPLSILDNVFASKKSQIIYSERLNNLSRNLPILIYVHYSKTSNVSEREISTLGEIRRLGIQILLVINSDLPQVPKIEFNFTDALIVRKNHGYDLGAYRDSFFELNKDGKVFEQPIIFMNNSVIWFPEMIGNYLRNMVEQKSDIIGASISYQYVPHLQTFLFTSKSKRGLNEITEWLSSIKNWRLKRTIVRLGELKTQNFFNLKTITTSVPAYSKLIEIGLIKLQSNFLQSGSYISRDVSERLTRNRSLLMAGIRLNPSHDYWLELIDEGFPGIKVDLIRSNPSGIADYELIISTLVSNGFDFRDIAELIQSNKPKSAIHRIRAKLRW